MKELLFDSIIEKETLENILALNQIKKCDAEIEKYTEEIKELNNEMKQILKDEEIDEGYIEKIHKYKNLLLNIDGDKGRIAELDGIIVENEVRIKEFQVRIENIEVELEILKKEIFETDDPSRVIECQNDIENLNVRLNDLNDILNGLISDNTTLLIEKEYLIAKNNDFDFSVPNFNKKELIEDLENITSEFNNAIEKLSLPVRENIEFCQKKIKNRELEIEKYTERKNMVIEAYPNSIGLDLQEAYKNIEKLIYELNLKHECKCVSEKNIFDTEESEETLEPVAEEVEQEEVIEEKEIKDEMISLENIEEAIEEDVIEEQVEEIKEVEETTEEVETEESETVEETENEEIGSVSYVLSDGESFVNIAEKVYPSSSNWEAIYYFNKDVIDKFLVSNGISNDFDTIKELANDTSLFTGIKLEIPTDYNYKI